MDKLSERLEAYIRREDWNEKLYHNDLELLTASAAIVRAWEGARAEVRRNPDGSADEVVGYGAFHLEQMDAGHWWIQLGPHMVNLTARGRIGVVVHENEYDEAGR